MTHSPSCGKTCDYIVIDFRVICVLLLFSDTSTCDDADDPTSMKATAKFDPAATLRLTERAEARRRRSRRPGTAREGGHSCTLVARPRGRKKDVGGTRMKELARARSLASMPARSLAYTPHTAAAAAAAVTVRPRPSVRASPRRARRRLPAYQIN